MAKSILSQLINKSAGDVANDTLNQALKRKATGPEKVSAAPRRVLSPRGLCSVQAHCEFGAAAAAFALFPSAAAPHRLFKTGSGANNFQRAHIYSTFKKKKKKQQQRTSARKLALRSGRSYLSGVRPVLAWPGFWPSASPNYTNCTLRPPRSERGGTKRCGTGSLASQRKMGTDEHIYSMNLRI